MKKRIVVFTTSVLLGYILLTSYQTGPAANGYNCTGAHNANTTCGLYGCHGAGTGPAVSITVDSGTTPVTHYAAGQAYRVHIHGAGTSMTWWGFEFTAVKGNGTGQTTAGSYIGSIPSPGLHTHTLASIVYVEHSNVLQTQTAGVFDTSFTWNAPATGVGTVYMYCTINAVNHDGNADGGDVSGNTSIQLVDLAHVAVNDVLNNIGIAAYPNPITNELSFDMNDAEAGSYNFTIYDINGRSIFAQTENITGSSYHANINTGNWAPGIYIMRIVKDGEQRTIQLVKQ